MKCVVNWIPLRIRVRSRSTQHYLKPRKIVAASTGNVKCTVTSTIISRFESF